MAHWVSGCKSRKRTFFHGLLTCAFTVHLPRAIVNFFVGSSFHLRWLLEPVWILHSLWILDLFYEVLLSWIRLQSHVHYLLQWQSSFAVACIVRYVNLHGANPTKHQW